MGCTFLCTLQAPLQTKQASNGHLCPSPHTRVSTWGKPGSHRTTSTNGPTTYPVTTSHNKTSPKKHLHHKTSPKKHLHHKTSPNKTSPTSKHLLSNNISYHKTSPNKTSPTSNHLLGQLKTVFRRLLFCLMVIIFRRKLGGIYLTRLIG